MREKKRPLPLGGVPKSPMGLEKKIIPLPENGRGGVPKPRLLRIFIKKSFVAGEALPDSLPTSFEKKSTPFRKKGLSLKTRLRWIFTKKSIVEGQAPTDFVPEGFEEKNGDFAHAEALRAPDSLADGPPSGGGGRLVCVKNY